LFSLESLELLLLGVVVASCDCGDDHNGQNDGDTINPPSSNAFVEDTNDQRDYCSDDQNFENKIIQGGLNQLADSFDLSRLDFVVSIHRISLGEIVGRAFNSKLKVTVCSPCDSFSTTKRKSKIFQGRRDSTFTCGVFHLVLVEQIGKFLWVSECKPLFHID